MNNIINEASEGAIQRNFTNPHTCVCDAMFYAMMTGQYAISQKLIACSSEMGKLAQSFEDDTGIQMIGLEGLRQAEQYAEAHSNDDVRLARIAELAKMKFMVEVMPASVNAEMVTNTMGDGHPGLPGFDANASIGSSRTLN